MQPTFSVDRELLFPVSMTRSRFVVCLLFAAWNLSGDTSADSPSGSPALLTFDELKQLYDQAEPPAPLADKLHTLLTTPFVNNSASEKGVRPLKPVVGGLGPSLILAQW